MKKCSVCKTAKPLSEFYNYRANRDGKSYRCKSCDTLARRKWQRENSESAKRSLRGRQLKFKYGITIEEYDALLKKQDNSCSICQGTAPRSHQNQSFCVDHSHVTGKIRGLLCSACNRAIGLLQDSPDILTAAARYLRRTSN